MGRYVQKYGKDVTVSQELIIPIVLGVAAYVLIMKRLDAVTYGVKDIPVRKEAERTSDLLTEYRSVVDAVNDAFRTTGVSAGINIAAVNNITDGSKLLSYLGETEKRFTTALKGCQPHYDELLDLQRSRVGTDEEIDQEAAAYRAAVTNALGKNFEENGLSIRCVGETFAAYYRAPTRVANFHTAVPPEYYDCLTALLPIVELVVKLRKCRTLECAHSETSWVKPAADMLETMAQTVMTIYRNSIVG